jgi:hypothetical protein
MDTFNNSTVANPPASRSECGEHWLGAPELAVDVAAAEDDGSQQRRSGHRWQQSSGGRRVEPTVGHVRRRPTSPMRVNVDKPRHCQVGHDRPRCTVRCGALARAAGMSRSTHSIKAIVVDQLHLLT